MQPRSNISSTLVRRHARAPVHINVTQGESRFVHKISACSEGGDKENYGVLNAPSHIRFG